jgi:hypothetical protein
VEYGVWITRIQCMDDRPQHLYCGISGTVCTMEYCTVDSIAHAKVSILVRPTYDGCEDIQVLWRESLEGIRNPTYANNVYYYRIFVPY